MLHVIFTVQLLYSATDPRRAGRTERMSILGITRPSVFVSVCLVGKLGILIWPTKRTRIQCSTYSVRPMCMQCVQCVVACVCIPFSLCRLCAHRFSNFMIDIFFVCVCSLRYSCTLWSFAQCRPCLVSYRIVSRLPQGQNGI